MEAMPKKEKKELPNWTESLRIFAAAFKTKPEKKLNETLDKELKELRAKTDSTLEKTLYTAASSKPNFGSSQGLNKAKPKSIEKGKRDIERDER